MAFDPTDWRPFPREQYDALIRSTSTQVVPRLSWPPHVPKMEANGNKVVGVWSWVPQDGQVALEVVREFYGDKPWKRDRWYLIETTDKRTWITRTPDKAIEEGRHHSDMLPAWPLR